MHHNSNAPETLQPEAIAAAVNRTMLYLVLWTVALTVFVASFQPLPLFLPTVSSSLAICAMAAAALAFLQRQAPRASYFTFWDVAGMLTFLALGAGMLSDPASAEAYLQSTATAETNPAAGDAARPPAPPNIDR